MFNLISEAFAQDGDIAAPVTDATKAAAATVGGAVPPPSMGDAFMMNMFLVLMVVVLFYFLVIKPQQRRMKEHTDLVTKLGKGERVVMQGGLIGVIADEGTAHEVTLDCNGNKFAVLRSAIMGRFDDMIPQAKAPAPGSKAANDDKAAKAAKADAARVTHEKTDAKTDKTSTKKKTK